MEGILKVTPAALRAKSSEFDQDRVVIRNLISEMNSKIGAITSTWQGDASTAYQNSYTGLRDDVERLNSMIAEHVRDLNEIADRYTKAEQTAESTNSALPKDAIQ